MAEFALGGGFDGVGGKARRQHSVEGVGRPASLDMAEGGAPHFEVDFPPYLNGDVLADAAQLGDSLETLVRFFFGDYAAADILRVGNEYATKHFNYFETYTYIALIYLLLTLLMSRFVAWLEDRMAPLSG